MPNRATPLVSAALRGDRAMVELLIAEGARADGAGGAYSNESPLWTAAQHGYANYVPTEAAYP